MKIPENKKFLNDELLSLLHKVAGNSQGRNLYLIHADIVKLLGICKSSCASSLARTYCDCFDLAFGDGNWMVPTFNYGFCRNGEFDIFKSPSEAGSLGEVLHRTYAERRTSSPVFSVFTNNLELLGSPPATTAFGHDSIFGHLHRNSGELVFLGVDPNVNTFIHYVEQTNSVGYRYHKKFEGRIKKGDVFRDHHINYFARPPRLYQEYDWSKINAALSENGILKKYSVNGASCYIANSGTLFNFWTKILANDELYFLNEKSVGEILKFKAKECYPFDQNHFEK